MNYRELLATQPVLPAPMCGISDYAQREICRAAGARYTFTQMVSAEAMVRNELHGVDVLDLEQGECDLLIQVFGGNPDMLAEAGRRIEAMGATVIDLNMGCPARKINNGNAGAALLRDMPRVAKIFKAMRRTVTVPLTVKMRWDWDEGDGIALEAARMAEAEGLDGVTLHARTRSQGYSGKADWDLIARMVEAVKIPVVGNGDIREPADAVEMMRATGCAAVMIGRALIGDPWLLRECIDAVARGSAEPGRRLLDWPTRIAMMLRHAELMMGRPGWRGRTGLLQFRKHAIGYIRGLRGAKKLREQLMKVETIGELQGVLAGHREVTTD
ncbi:tRNA dihydrouridine synthase DusB [bacterium]|nr:tRNA dihydrouridine synthase DusB [bacterium]